jgi:hypothetical protein
MNGNLCCERGTRLGPRRAECRQRPCYCAFSIFGPVIARSACLIPEAGRAGTEWSWWDSIVTSMKNVGP